MVRGKLFKNNEKKCVFEWFIQVKIEEYGIKSDKYEDVIMMENVIFRWAVMM